MFSLFHFILAYLILFSLLCLVYFLLFYLLIRCLSAITRGLILLSAIVRCLGDHSPVFAISRESIIFVWCVLFFLLKSLIVLFAFQSVAGVRNGIGKR